jgi:hypothetical protein
MASHSVHEFERGTSCDMRDSPKAEGLNVPHVAEHSEERRRICLHDSVQVSRAILLFLHQSGETHTSPPESPFPKQTVEEKHNSF